MSALGDLQRAIREAVLGGHAGCAAALVVADGLPPEARLQIYGHHVLSTLTTALGVTYPVVCRLVDRRFFAYAADHFVRAHPPSGPCLHEYGDRFADFLAEFPACRDQRYLADVARLEWALHVAAHADEIPRLDASRLAQIAAEDMPRLVLALEPSVSLLASAWPIDRIWRVNQREASAGQDVDLDAGGVHLEVRRRDGVPSMRALDPAVYRLREAIALGRTLEQAAEAALEVDGAFDLTRALHELIEDRILVDYRVADGPRAE